MWNSKVYGRYLRLRLTTAASAGTTALIVNGYNIDIGQAQVQPVSGTVSISGTPTVSISANQVFTPVPQAAQGTSTYHTLVSAATTNATSVKNSAGVISMLVLTNTSAAFKYIKLCNTTTAPTVGTTTPIFNIGIPPNSTITVDTGPFATRFSTGISYAITGAPALLDATVIAANDVLVNIAYT
jgi:hypothetical protein